MPLKSKHKNKSSNTRSSERKVAFDEARVRLANQCNHPELQLNFFHTPSHSDRAFSNLKECYIPFNSNNGQLFLAYFSQWNQVSEQEFDNAFSLFTTNMKSLYEQTQRLGWTPDKRRTEMREPNARYIFVYESFDRPTSNPDVIQAYPNTASTGPLIAFVHYRFDMDYDRAVLYLYELQVNAAYRRSGIGSWIVTSVIEPLAAAFHMQRVRVK